MSDIAERAEAALVGITPGRWELIGGNEYLVGPGIMVGSPDGIRHEDAEFITAAPELVAELLAELKAARIERDKARVELSRLRRIAIQSLVDCTEMTASWWRKLPASDPRARRSLAWHLGHTDEEHEAWVKDPHGFFAARLDKKGE